MKKHFALMIFTLLCMCREKDEFDINNPDVETFVQQLKEGTYNNYMKAESGDNLWLLMPEFSSSHIQSLIDLSIDTSYIRNFSVNPISSRTPFPNERDYFILGECLLWTVEGIRNGSGYGSLDPYLIDNSLVEKYNGLNGLGIYHVRDLYIDWWESHSNGNWKEINPLEGSNYIWF